MDNNNEMISMNSSFNNLELVNAIRGIVREEVANAVEKMDMDTKLDDLASNIENLRDDVEDMESANEEFIEETVTKLLSDATISI